MSFKRRYMDSLLSTSRHPLPEPVSGRAIGGNWWRRFLASLLDVPAVGGLSSHAAPSTAPETVAEGRAGRQPPKTVLRARYAPAPAPAQPLAQAPQPEARPVTVAGPERATIGNRVIVARRSRSWGWAVAGASLCLLVGLFALVNRQSPSPIVTQPAPTQSILPTSGSTDTTDPGTDMGDPTGPPPSTPAGTPGQVLWQGTLAFPSQPGSDTHPVAATPATALLAGETLYLCAGCSPQVIGGDWLVPWNEMKPPTPDQCSSALAARTIDLDDVPLRVGQMGCFSSGTGTVGYLTVLTRSPLSASATIWHT